MVKLYCPKCMDVYTPKSSRHHHTDGAYFGTGFPHMLFMVHPEYRPKRPANQFVPRSVRQMELKINICEVVLLIAVGMLENTAKSSTMWMLHIGFHSMFMYMRALHQDTRHVEILTIMSSKFIIRVFISYLSVDLMLHYTVYII